MPIKKDGTGKRWVEMEVLVPGTPEQVWAAMATGEGNAAWFTRAEIEERVGGALEFDFGPGARSSGQVTMWEPPHRFGYVETQWSDGAPPVATEITITSRSGDQCLVRMVHSLFSSSDDWDDQMESFESGWPGFFAVLRIYLGHFAGEKGASFQAMTSIEEDHRIVWKRLVEGLGLAGADVGDERAVQEPHFAGVVESLVQDAKVRFLLLRLNEPCAGVALIGTYGAGAKVNASMSLFFYGERAREIATASEGEFRAWLERMFPAG